MDEREVRPVGEQRGDVAARWERARRAASVAWWEYDVETGEYASEDERATALGYDATAFDSPASYRTIMHDADRAVTAAALETVVAGVRDAYDVQYRLRGADGEYRWFRDVGRVTDVDDDGNPTRVSALVLRSTPSQNEAVLADRNEALALVNRIVRHDIRNDLNVLKGWLELFAEDPAFVTPERVDELVTVVDESITLTESIRDVVAMVEADDDVETQPTNGAVVMHEEIGRVRAASPDATIDADALPDRPVIANALLSSVFRNLLANAIEHATHDDVHVSVHGSTDDDAGTVSFRIADDGPGIPDDRKRVLFDATARTVDRIDHGLGLYLVNALVTAYGGTVDVDDNTPIGTVVTVTLDAA